MESASQSHDSLSCFPAKLPEAAIAVLFSKKNIDRVVERARHLHPKPASPDMSEKTPGKRTAAACLPLAPASPHSPQRFSAALQSRLTQWESLDPSLTAQKSAIQDRMPQLYELYCKVGECGGFFRTVGYDLWARIEREMGLERGTAREVYEGVIAVVDASLHPDADPTPAFWPLWKLSCGQSIPCLSHPETLKSLKRFLSLPCFILREDSKATVSRDVKQWAIDTLRLTLIREAPQTLVISQTETVVDAAGVTVVAANIGSTAITAKVRRSDSGMKNERGKYWYVIVDPGDVLVVQGREKIEVKTEESESEMVTVRGLPQNAERLMAAIESQNSADAIPLFSLIFDMLTGDTPLLSVRSRYQLSEKLLREIEDWNPSEPVVQVSGVRNCSLCSQVLFCLGRKCVCEKAFCIKCFRSLFHPCVNTSLSWVQTDLRSPSSIVTTLRAMQSVFTSSLPLNTRRKRFPELANGHKS